MSRHRRQQRKRARLAWERDNRILRGVRFKCRVYTESDAMLVGRLVHEALERLTRP
jgi:hypothetical protein